MSDPRDHIKKILDPGERPLADPARYHFTKAELFHTILVDGGAGSVDGYGRVALAIYNERRPLPLREPGNEPTSGVVREIQAELIMSSQAAIQIGEWLIEHGQKAWEIEKLLHAARVREESGK